MNAPTELKEIARHVVWFKPPEETLADVVFFLVHLMTHGTHEEVVAAQKHFDMEDFRRALENAPPGVFTARAWAYWNMRMGRVPVPPLPRRKFEQAP